MSTFLEKYQSIVPWIQKIILGNVGASDLAANIPVEGATQLSTPLEQHGQTDPKAYNEMQSMLYVDLAALYGEAQLVDGFIGTTESLYKRTIQQMRDGLTRVANEIYKYRHLLRLGEGSSCVAYDTFVDASSKETNRTFYTNPPVLDADLDEEAEAITLPKVGKISRILSSKRRVPVARFEMDHKLGAAMSYLVEDTRHSMNSAIDSDRNTFWAETVLSDQAIRIKPTWLTWMKTAHSSIEITDGAACKCHVMFQYKSFINRIVLRPFAHGPLTLVCAYSIPGDNDEVARRRGEVTWLVTEPIEIKDTHVIHFPRHKAKRVYFVFQQRNYVRNVYQVPRIQKFNIETWNRIAQAEAESSTDLMSMDLSFEQAQNPAVAQFDLRNRALSQRKVDEITGYSLFLEYAKRVKNWIVNNVGKNKPDSALQSIISAMSSILKDKGLTVDPKSYSLKEIDDPQDQLISMSALEYVYGLYDLEIEDVYYASTGYFVTKAFPISGRAVEFTLKMTADIPDGTEVSSYLSYRHNDTVPAWLPATGPIPVMWPDNSDFTIVTDTFTGGHGSIISPKQSVYVHPCARAQSVSVGGVVINFNYTNPNRAYEPGPSEVVEGYITQVRWNSNLDPVQIPIRDTAVTWTNDLAHSVLPLVMTNGNWDKLGITDDPTRTDTYILNNLPVRHRIYYRPVQVFIKAGNQLYQPDMYGEPYFVTAKKFTLPISTPMLMKSTISGTINMAPVTGLMSDDLLVRIKTLTGAEREISLTDIAYFASMTDVNNRITKWDSHINLEVMDTTYQLYTESGTTQLTLPSCGVLIVGIKKWLDNSGTPLTNQNAMIPSEQNVKVFKSENVIDGRYYDVVFPVLSGNTPAINVKFDQGLIQVLDGYKDGSGNKYPYLGFMAIKLNHFVEHQPVFVNPPLGTITKNVTDYRVQKMPHMKKWNLNPKDPAYYPVIEYYHDLMKNTLQFAAPIPPEWNMVVMYGTYAPDVRVKFELRGTGQLSPVIEDFMVEAKEA